MGAHPWSCFTPYRKDLDDALQFCQEVEFQAGRYNGGDDDGPAHDSIEEAIEDADADGTCSILDVCGIGGEIPSDSDERQLSVAYALSIQRLIELFNTDKPTRETFEKNRKRAMGRIYEDLDRGQAIYIILYNNDQPSELFFAGYSFD
jgi:hypothetical protein